MSTLRGGGLSTLRGGGLSTLRGGGLSTLRGGGLSTLRGGGLSTLSEGGLLPCLGEDSIPDTAQTHIAAIYRQEKRSWGVPRTHGYETEYRILKDAWSL